MRQVSNEINRVLGKKSRTSSGSHFYSSAQNSQSQSEEPRVMEKNPEKMLACQVCGTYAPASVLLHKNGLNYCSKECLNG